MQKPKELVANIVGKMLVWATYTMPKAQEIPNFDIRIITRNIYPSWWYWP